SPFPYPTRFRSRGDDDRWPGDDLDRELDRRGVVVGVGGRGGDRVDAARERARRQAGARADHAVAARGPREAAREIAVLEVEGDRREGQGVAEAHDRQVWRPEEDDLRPGGDVQVDLGAAGEVAAVRGGGGDGVQAERERIRADARAGAERAVAVGGPA